MNNMYVKIDKKINVKRSAIKTLAYSSLLLGMLSVTTNTVSAAPNENREENIVDLIEEQEVSIVELIELIKIKEEDAMVLSSKIEEKELELADNQKKIDSKNDEIDTTEGVIQETEKELEEKINLYNENIEVAAERAKSLQKGSQDKSTLIIETFLQGENILDVFHKLRALGIILDAHDKQIEELNQQADEIELIKRSLEKEKKDLISEREEMNSLQLKLDEDREKLSGEEDELNNIINELTKEKEILERSYNGNLDELFHLQETQSGVQLYNEMQRMEAQRNNAATISSSGIESLESSLREIRSRSVNKDKAKQVIEEAHTYLGVNYVWGGSGRSGIDCSGLTQAVYSTVGIRLPRVSHQQAKVGRDIPLSQAQPGDLLYWNRAGKTYHVAVYIGNGNYIHAPRPGKTVNITSVKHFTPSGARRILPEGHTDSNSNNSSGGNIQKGDLIGEFSATSYAVGGWSVPGTVTANGTDISNTIHTKDGHRIIAVDPNVIPMNTVVVVDIPGQEPFTAKASDTGGAIKGNIIDVLMSSPAESKRFGRKHGIKVYRY